MATGKKVGIAVGVLVVGLAASFLVSHPWTAVLGLRVECPLTDSIIVDTPFVATRAARISAAGRISNVPEFHDCQRFALKKKKLQLFRRVGNWPFYWPTIKTYDSLYAIFVSESLDVRWRVDTILLPRTDSDTGSIRVPIPETQNFVVNEPDKGSYVLFAQIVSWGGHYEPLGIGPGYNCLYMRGPTSPVAKMVQYGREAADCLAYTASGRPEKDLIVKREAPAGFALASIPKVGRWDWDAVAREHYIIIACGRGAWCEVGDTGFTSSLAQVTAVPNNAVELAANTPWAIKLWYDEQRLAVGTTQSSLSDIHAVAVPHPQLDTYTDASFTQGWMPAASVVISKAHADYSSKLNLIPVPSAGAEPNTFELCHGSKATCRGVPDALQCAASTAAEAVGDVRWYARITQAGTPLLQLHASEEHSIYRCVLRRAHDELSTADPDVPGSGPIHIPGTIRWRWQANDETVWMRCAQGCCEVQ